MDICPCCPAGSTSGHKDREYSMLAFWEGEVDVDVAHPWGRGPRPGEWSLILFIRRLAGNFASEKMKAVERFCCA